MIKIILWPEDAPDLPGWLRLIYSMITEIVIYYWLRAIIGPWNPNIPESE